MDFEAARAELIEQLGTEIKNKRVLAPKTKAPVAAAEVSNITAELKTIGIVAGIIIVILVILALIFA
jgi:uncharacterized membrane protein YvbJ